MKPIISLLWGLVVLAICHLTAWADISAPPQNIQLQIGSIPTTKSITQYGITWTFAEPVPFGQFVNGDFWVVAPGSGVKIINISPGYITSPRKMNGSMINPSTQTQGYDDAITYSDSLNVGIGLSESTPLILVGNTSLVSTLSTVNLTGTNSVVDKAAVLTILTSAPSAGSFRPGYSGTSKTLYNVNSVNLSLLKKLAVPSGQAITAETLTNYASRHQMAWIDHNGTFTARFLHPASTGIDNYYYPKTFAESALLLNLNFTDAEKRTLLINYIQLGIDLYSYINSGANGWPPDGGHSNGRKWPILFAGIMLNDTPMKNIGQKSGDYLYHDGHGAGNPPSDYLHFGEDGQTFYVAQSDIDITSNTTWIIDIEKGRPGFTGSLHWYPGTQTFRIETKPSEAVRGPWNPDARNDSSNKLNVYCRPYTTSLIGMPEWGIRYSTYRALSDSSWTAEYRAIASGPSAWAGTSLAARIMGAKSLWNHPAHFDYIDRYMAITKGDPDPFGYTVQGEVAAGRPSGLIGAMWDTYRAHY